MSVEADLPPHMRETFQTLGFEAPAAPGGRNGDDAGVASKRSSERAKLGLG